MRLVDMNKLYVRFKCLQRDEISVFGLCVLVLLIWTFFFYYYTFRLFVEIQNRSTNINKIVSIALRTTPRNAQ